MIIDLLQLTLGEKIKSIFSSTPSNSNGIAIKNLYLPKQLDRVMPADSLDDFVVIDESIELGGKNPISLACVSDKNKEIDFQNKYKLKSVYQHAGVWFSIQSKIKRIDNLSVEFQLYVSGKYKPKNKSEVSFAYVKYAFDREINIRSYNNTRCLTSFTINTVAYYRESGSLPFTAIFLPTLQS